MKLAQALVFVADVERMKAFYSGTLGLPILDEQPGFVRLDAGGCALALHALPREIACEPSGDPRTDSWLKLCFHADDVAATRAKLAAAGVVMRDLVQFENVTLCDGVDPEGNVFQITSR